MFRRAVFALMLIGAAFAGGAVINGPGLAWLQRNFLGGPSIIVDHGDSSRGIPSAKPQPFPTAQTSTLPIDLGPIVPAPPKKNAGTRPSTELALAETPLLPESPSAPSAALAPIPQAVPGEEDPPIPPLPATGAEPKPPQPSPLPRLEPSPPPKSDPVARLASVERSANPAPVSSWAEIREKMKAMGVVRYTIEGEPGGRVRFRCVIPVEGLKAVGHHFEAEGDDEPQAAEAALKRIALWKATASPTD